MLVSMKEITTIALLVIVAVVVVSMKVGRQKTKPVTAKSDSEQVRTQPEKKNPYTYTRRPYVMTKPESSFYKRLKSIVKDSYLIFPQIHLSSLAINTTADYQYQKAGFQRINRRSVDYILVDPETMQTVYAIELDDRTHDTQKGKYADFLKSDVLKQVSIPLVRFRNPDTMSDQDIIETFKRAKVSLQYERYTD